MNKRAMRTSGWFPWMAPAAFLLFACNGGGGGGGDGEEALDLPDILDATDGRDYGIDPREDDVATEEPSDGPADVPAEELPPGTVRVPLWHPYAEWSFENPAWDGNPFDLQAQADFSDGRSPHLFHDGGTTWKLRYMCTETGLYTFTTSSDDPDLDSLEGAVLCEPNPGAMGLLAAGGDGNRRFYVRGWEKAVVPAWCMMPDISRNSSGEPAPESLVDEWIAANIDGTGFLGAHNMGPANIWYDWECDGTRSGCSSEDPDPRTFREFEALMEKLYDHGAFVHIWLFWDCQRDKCDKFHDDAPKQERMRHYLADRWGAIPNWMAGEGFDNFEDDDTAFADKWFHDIHDRLAWPHLLGMRSMHNSYELICTECSYYSWENVEMTYERWVESFDHVADRPSFEEDRYRVRDEGRPKDIPPDRPDLLLRNHLWPQVMAGGVGAVYGYLYGSPGGYSLPGGYPADWEVFIRAWHVFWYESGPDPVHRFLPDMVRCNELTDGYGLCAPGRAYVFYKADTGSIDVDLSGLAGEAPAVAMNAWTGELLDLGTVGPSYGRFEAPHSSDWALAVGDFE